MKNKPLGDSVPARRRAPVVIHPRYLERASMADLEDTFAGVVDGICRLRQSASGREVVAMEFPE